MKASINRVVTTVTTSIVTTKVTTKDTETNNYKFDSEKEMYQDTRDASLYDWEKRSVDVVAIDDIDDSDE